MNNKNADLLHKQNGTENNGTQEQIMERLPIPGTPFITVGNKEDGYLLTMGRYKLSEPMKSPLDVELWLNMVHWDITVKIALIIAEEIINEKIKKQ